MGPRRLGGRRAAASLAPPCAGQLRSCEGPAFSRVPLASPHGFRGLQLLGRSLRFCTLTPQRGSGVLPGARSVPGAQARGLDASRLTCMDQESGSGLPLLFFMTLLVLNIGYLKVLILWKITDVLGFYCQFCSHQSSSIYGH